MPLKEEEERINLEATKFEQSTDFTCLTIVPMEAS
jgi:hypothetical protein